MRALLALTVLSLLLTGCRAQPPPTRTTARQAPDLANCIVLNFRLDTPTSPELDRLFGNKINYETDCCIALFRSWYERGYITRVHYPSRQASLGYEDKEKQVITGFYPPLVAGRLPARPGEAVIAEAGPHERVPQPWFGAKPDITRRELGAVFSVWETKPLQTYRVVGLTACSNSMWDEIWVHPPVRPNKLDFDSGRSGRSASVILPMPVDYESLRARMTKLGLRWSAMRIIGGKQDKTWRHTGHDQARVDLDLVGVSGASPYLMVQQNGYSATPRPPLALGDLRLEFNGQPFAVNWENWAKQPVDRIGNDNATGHFATAPAPGHYRMCVYIKDQFDSVSFIDLG